MHLQNVFFLSHYYFIDLNEKKHPMVVRYIIFDATENSFD